MMLLKRRKPRIPIGALILAGILGGVSDTIKPTCTIASSDADPTIVSPITVTFTWSEAVTGFTVDDVTVGNGTKSTFATVDTSHYTLLVIPDAGATVTVDVAADVCQDAAGNNNEAATQYTVASKVLLWDDFTDTLAAGAVNGTAPTPGPGGNRVVTDGNSKLSVGSDVANFATGGVGAGNPGLWYSAITRGAGGMLVSKITPGATCRLMAGADSNQAADIVEGVYFFASAQMYDTPTGGVQLGFAWANGTAYTIITVFRASGSYHFIRTATGDFKLILFHATGNTATLYPSLSILNGTTTIALADFVRAFKEGTYLPTPLCYDTFQRANGALGNSETTGPDSQTVTARAWAATLGTWAIATNAANCSALDGTANVGIATIPATHKDVVAAVNVIRAAGQAGLVLRYQDADNYLYAHHDGTNVALVSRAAGVESNIIGPTASLYAAGGTILVILDGTTAYLYYRGNYIGTGTVPDSAYAVHGLYTNNTGPTMDNFTVLPRGNNNEYDALENYSANF